MNSKSNKRLLKAYNIGYRVINNNIVSPFTEGFLSGKITNSGYIAFTIDGYNVDAHRLVAFQKFGFKLFDSKIVVRHIDNNKLNNMWDNIMIGTQKDNILDNPVSNRVKYSINASTKIRKFTDKEMEQIRKFHRGSYKETMGAFNITSKGTLHYILNTKYVTKK